MKKKKLIIGFAAMFLLPVLLNAQEAVNIGNVTVEGSHEPYSFGVNSSGESAVYIEGDALKEQGKTTAADALDDVSGVYVNKTGILTTGIGPNNPSTIKMRGLGDTPNSGILTVIDGIPQFMGIWRHPLYDTLSLANIDTIEVIKGPAGVEFGNQAVGGVINITTLKPVKDGMQTELGKSFGNYFTQGLFLSNEGKFGKYDYSVSGSLDSTDGYRANSDSYSQDYSVRGGDVVVGNLYVGAAGSYSSVKGFNPGPLGANWPREWGAYEIIDRNYSLKFENEADGLKSRLLVSSETGSNTVNNPPYMGNTYSTFENYGARFSEEGKAGDVLGFKAGFDWQNYGGRVGNYYADPSMDMTAGRYENDYAPYVMISGGTSALEINAGARYAINDKWGDEFLPQVGFKYKYSSDGDIYLNYSKGYRTPALGDAIMTVSPQDFAKFKPENFMQYEAGIEHSVEKLFACKLTVYQMEGTNILRPDPAFPYSPFAFLDTGNMLIKGAEADLHSDISKTFTFGTSMSYADPREKTAHFAYFTGKVYAKLALDKLTLDADMDFAKDRFDADNNGASLADYAILNGEASYTTDLGGINTTIYVSAQNFLDKEYYVENAYTAPGIFIKSGLFIKL